MPDPVWPVTVADIHSARDRIRRWLRPTPLRHYPTLDAEVGSGIRVLVKHENHQPTGAFKVRNALAAMTALAEEDRRRGVTAATAGNHGLGLAYAGALLAIPVTICVPRGANREKVAAIRGFGAAVVEEGRDYDEATEVADRLASERGMTLIHSTDNASVIAGAGTLALEILADAPDVDAMVVSIGGGSQAVGALTVMRASRPTGRVYGVQAEGADAIYRSWRAGHPVTTPDVRTFADGIATRVPRRTTLGALCEGLAGFVTVSDEEIAAALRLLLRTTHNLAEGAGAAGLAGLLELRDELAHRTVAIVLSGANIDAPMLRRVLNEGLPA